MLNRLYIVIGTIVILVLAAAFIVPRLVPWSDYRGRMETLAGAALGTPVRINGDISFSLLPQPHLVIDDVSVGPANRPVIAVKSADADFSLIDFLRDRYVITALTLEQPLVSLGIEANGSLITGLKPPGSDSQASLSVTRAAIRGGTLRIADIGAGRSYEIAALDGDLSLGSLTGPFAFSGDGRVDGRRLSMRANASPLAADSTTHVTIMAQPESGDWSFNADGTLTTADVPHFTGSLSYRRAAPKQNNPNGVIGDLQFASKLDMTPEKAVLAAFTLVPDENRGATRLTGSATVDLGRTPNFTASVASSVLAMPPRDATQEEGPQPYELVRMLGELPVAPVPPIAGTLTAEVDEVDLRSVSLASVSLDAATDGRSWSINSLSGQLAGGTTVTIGGQLTATDGHPSFAGTLAIKAKRLDALASLWRKTAPGNPLFGLPGAFSSKLSLSAQTLGLTDGRLTLNGTTHQLTALVTFGRGRRVDVSGQFGRLGATDTAALLALAPDISRDQTAAVTFPQGAVSLSAASATLFGLSGHGLDVEGKWGPDGLNFSQVSAADLGGAKFNLAVAASGSLAKPNLSADGTVSLPAGGGPALDMLFDRLETPAPVRKLLVRSLPADLKLHVDGIDSGGGQGLTLSGKAGAAHVDLVAKLDGGLAKALAAPIDTTLTLQSGDPTALTAQLGLGDVSLMPEQGPMQLVLSAHGDPTATLATSLTLSGGGDSIAFSGTVEPGGLSAIGGSGTVKVKLSDSSVLAAALGLDGIDTPPLEGKAGVKLAPEGDLTLENIAGDAQGDKFTGTLALNRDARGATVSGQLAVDRLDLTSLLAATGSPTALMRSSDKLWPDGPISLGQQARPTTGSVTVTTPAITRSGQPFLDEAKFDFGWDATNIGVHELRADLGKGQLTLDANLCCSGPLADKRLGGQGSVTGVALSDLVPPAVAATLGGTVQASVRFSATGDSVDALARSLTGDGSFTLSDMTVQKFDPDVFKAVAATKDIVDLDAATLTGKVAAALDNGSFAAPKLAGGFTIAGGTLNIANVGTSTAEAKLFGGATVKLPDGALGGSFALSPVGKVDPAGLISPTTAQITAELGGTLTAPTRTLDIASMVEALKVQALQNEVDRLEKLKARDDANAKADADAKKEAVEDAARQQQQAEEARQAAEKAAADKAAADKAAAAAAAGAGSGTGGGATAPSPVTPAAPEQSPAGKPPAALPTPLQLQMPQPQFFQPLQ